MITLYLSDGLGNQMFQYACARSLQLQTRNKLSFSLSKFKNDQSRRTYALGNFNIHEDTTILSKTKEYFDLLLFKLQKKLIRSDKDYGYVGKHCICSAPVQVYGYLDFTNIKFGRNIQLYGQFQNPKYFEKYSDVIRSELRVKTEPSQANCALINEIKSANSVCVHIRRGDYLSDRWKHLNVCDYTYYINSMKKSSEKIDSPIFYIFSNGHEDIAWIKNNYDFKEFDVKYVDLGNPDYEELRLMYSCKHFIISNSTYSWWAQYLGDDEKKIVVAPSVWNKKIDETIDLYLPNWVLIEV